MANQLSLAFQPDFYLTALEKPYLHQLSLTNARERHLIVMTKITNLTTGVFFLTGNRFGWVARESRSLLALASGSSCCSGDAVYYYSAVVLFGELLLLLRFNVYA